MDIIIGLSIAVAVAGVIWFLAGVGKRSSSSVTRHIPDPPPRDRSGGGGSGDDLP